MHPELCCMISINISEKCYHAAKLRHPLIRILILKICFQSSEDKLAEENLLSQEENIKYKLLWLIYGLNWTLFSCYHPGWYNNPFSSEMDYFADNLYCIHLGASDPTFESSNVRWELNSYRYITHLGSTCIIHIKTTDVYSFSNNANDQCKITQYEIWFNRWS